jgi:hypothetical protein
MSEFKTYGVKAGRFLVLPCARTECLPSIVTAYFVTGWPSESDDNESTTKELVHILSQRADYS